MPFDIILTDSLSIDNSTVTMTSSSAIVSGFNLTVTQTGDLRTFVSLGTDLMKSFRRFYWLQHKIQPSSKFWNNSAHKLSRGKSFGKYQKINREFCWHEAACYENKCARRFGFGGCKFVQIYQVEQFEFDHSRPWRWEFSAKFLVVFS